MKHKLATIEELNKEEYKKPIDGYFEIIEENGEFYVEIKEGSCYDSHRIDKHIKKI